MSTRTTIIDELLTVLKAISGIGEVDRQWKSWDQTARFPACFVTGGTETYRQNAGPHYDSEMEILIAGYVRDENDPDLAIDNHLEDVIQAFANLDRPKFLAGVETFGRFYAPYGIFELTIRVDYEFTLASP